MKYANWPLPDMPKFVVTWGRNGRPWVGFADCNTVGERVRAIRDAMRKGMDWIEVFEY